MGRDARTTADGSFRIEAKAGLSTIIVLRQPEPIIKRGVATPALAGASSTMGSAYSGVQTREGRLTAGLCTTTAAS